MGPSCSWSPPPAPCSLAAEEVHVWRAALDLPDWRIAELARILSADESSRARRFYFERDRRHYTAAHGLLRAILSRYLNAAPQQLRFGYNAYGKPSLPENEIHFNMSHSGELALYAFARRRELGVDVEQVRTDFEYDEEAQNFFALHEQAALHALPAELKPAAFFNCWTRKEAFIKAIGQGISFPLDQFEVSLAPGEAARLLSIRGDPIAAALWGLADLDVGPGYAAALVVEGAAYRLCCFQWHEESEG